MINIGQMPLAKLEQQPNGCIRWLGRLQRGAPVHTIKGAVIRVHRYIYTSTKGVSLDRSVPLQPFCGDERCVNPDHQKLGDYSKTRAARTTQFTPFQVKFIRAWTGSIREVAERFGCSVSAVYALKARRRHTGTDRRRKLTPDQELAIAYGVQTSAQLARRFGVTQGTVCRIKKKHEQPSSRKALKAAGRTTRETQSSRRLPRQAAQDACTAARDGRAENHDHEA